MGNSLQLPLCRIAKSGLFTPAHAAKRAEDCSRKRSFRPTARYSLRDAAQTEARRGWGVCGAPVLCPRGGGAGVTSLRQGPTGRLECHGCRAQRGGCLSASGVLAAGHVEALRNDGGPAVLSSGRATFGALWVSQAQPPAVQVLGGLLAVQELTAGPSKWALELKAWRGAIDVKSANCGEVDCGFHVNEKWLTDVSQRFEFIEGFLRFPHLRPV